MRDRLFGFAVFAALIVFSGCSKENNVSADNNVGSCRVDTIPAGTCPQGFSPEIVGQGQQCAADAGTECKTVGSCTVRCVDPRPCIQIGGSCSSGGAACCDQDGAKILCVGFTDDLTKEETRVCSPPCKTSADCPGSCCDASINQGSTSVCAPSFICLADSIPPGCKECAETQCPDESAACKADATCNGCAEGAAYKNSPECLGNPTLKLAMRCAFQKCTAECRSQ